MNVIADEYDSVSLYTACTDNSTSNFKRLFEALPSIKALARNAQRTVSQESTVCEQECSFNYKEII